MKSINVQLTRNLRKNILQGQPWVYRQSIQVPEEIKSPTLAKVKNHKKEFVCWGMYDPQSPLALRVLSLEEKPPKLSDFELRLQKAYELRRSVNSDETTAYRLMNGEGDLLPGFICDIYHKVAVMQFDGSGPYEFWDQEWLAEWILKNTSCETVYFKPRHDSKLASRCWGKEIKEELIEVKEKNALFYVDVFQGQKTGFFLDQRENRDYIRSISSGKSVMNLFSYSGGFSIYAGLGGAKKVTSVDIAQGALDLSDKNWKLNQLSPEKHETQCVDVFEFIHNCKQKYDIVICDPPSLAKSEKHKEAAMQKYIETFAAAAKRVNPNGHLVMSSCSSHISFEDFQEIIAAALSKSRKRGQVLRVSGQGSDHPYPHACPHLRYLKFVDVVIL